MISLKSLLTEGKRVNIPITGEKITFTMMIGRDGRVIFLPSSSAELDKIDGMRSEWGSSDAINNEIKLYLEKQLKVPFEHDRDYPGSGYAFTIDLDKLISKLK